MPIQPNEPIRFLILDDEPDQIVAMRENLIAAWRRSRDLFGAREPKIEGANRTEDALALLEAPQFPYDLVLADLFMPFGNSDEPHEEGGAHKLFEAFKSKPLGYRRPLLVITTNRRKDAEELLREIHEGSYEEHLDWVTYLEKPKNAPGPVGTCDLLEVKLWTQFLLDCVRAARDSEFRQGFMLSRLDEVLSFSPTLKKLKSDATRHRNQPLILISGEWGSGKERVAEHIHLSSSRAKKKLETLNVSALPANLIETEVFGAEKGSYTGCTERRIGILERAITGTVFLDEFGKDEEITRHLCDKLARVLSEPRQFRRVGGIEDFTFSGTLILGGSRLSDLLQRATREPEWMDFFSRVSGKPLLRVPALREHPEDIIPLARYFLRRSCQRLAQTPKQLDPSAEGWLLAQPWTGNIRQLENVIGTAAALDPIKLTDDDLQDILPVYSPAAKTVCAVTNPASVLTALERFGGNRAAAAQFLNVSDKTLRTWIKKHADSDPKFSAECPPATRGRGRPTNTEK
jgi:DNA-binding NtrC family response regulator